MKKLTVNEYLALNSDERYAEAVKATIATMNEALFNKYHRVTKNRWLDLTRVWDNVYTGEKHKVLTYVLHNIYWGVYPYEFEDPEMHYLLSLVEAELLDDGEAFESLSQWSVFKNLLETIAGETSSYGDSGIDTHLLQHHHYLGARLRCKVQYHKTRPDGFGEYVREYESYEKIVVRFAPEVVNWTREQWGNDLNVAAALEDRYGVDYVASGRSEDDFDRIVMLCRELDYWGDTDNVIWYAANIVQFPLDMAKVVWPVAVEDNVTKLFLAAYKATVRYEKSGQLCLDKKHKYFHPVGHFEREALKDSWLYQNVHTWYIEGKYTGEQEKEVKMALFDLQMTTC